jgi:hypothetical protein
LKTKLFLLFILSISANIFAQTETNLDLIYKLINNSVVNADSIIGGKQSIIFSVTTPQTLDVLKPKIIQSFNEHGYTLKSLGDSEATVNYNLTYSKVEYKDSFTDGLFGGALVEREVSISGVISVTKSNKISSPVEFTKSIKDTIQVNDISKIENQSLPFTHAQIPSMPLLSNLWEPIVVVGTLIVTVILLFTVRSK